MLPYKIFQRMRPSGYSLATLLILMRKNKKPYARFVRQARQRGQPISSSRMIAYMLHHREGEKLDDWLANVTKSQIHELRSFVLGVERDKTAVVAGLTFPQNNGIVLQPHLCDTMRGKQTQGGRDGSVSLNRRSADLGRSFRRSARAFSSIL